MAEMALIKYHYAYDESKQVININDVSSIERSKHSYYCVGCGAEMIPRLGKINAHHFAHKVSQEYCGSETYFYISLQNKLSRESLILVKNLKYLIANPLNVIRAGRALCEKYVRIKMLRHLL